ncbi:MAG: UDP-4-amino-4,6-dideoxy-N-acetyl-beta-L-altrosamine transaminase [Methanoregula sp.]|nr:UDP-4-amino-4,6-dideoxy-N-acetyl-beta-L-altrosamine transaminase [Methanoregula sp.]
MKNTLALYGGTPVRQSILPYGKQWIGEEDIEAVARVLRSDWLTTGPMIQEFETAFAIVAGTRNAVAVSNGTAALHAITYAVGIKLGDEVIVPSMTFAASANCVVYQGATPVFADVDESTLLIDPKSVEERITEKTRAIIAVDYAGQACDYPVLREIADEHDLILIADACHALGGSLNNAPVGSLADISAFSLHPVKHITSGEGGMVTTDNPLFANKARLFRAHGITTDHRQRESMGSWFYEMVDLGYNYRITDFQCALGISQLKKLMLWIRKRQEIARIYDKAFSGSEYVRPLTVREGVSHAYHLYVIHLDTEKIGAERNVIFSALRAEGIGVNVHYIPVHMHPFYRTRFGTGPGLCPSAEHAYESIITIPMYPRMSDGDIQDVITAVLKVTGAFP